MEIHCKGEVEVKELPNSEYKVVTIENVEKISGDIVRFFAHIVDSIVRDIIITTGGQQENEVDWEEVVYASVRDHLGGDL